MVVTSRYSGRSADTHLPIDVSHTCAGSGGDTAELAHHMYRWTYHTHAQASKITKKTKVAIQCGKHRARVVRTKNDIIDVEDKEDNIAGP